MLNISKINSGAFLGLTIAALVAVPNPINASTINSTTIANVGKQLSGTMQAFSGAINRRAINAAPLLLVGKQLVANNAKKPDGFINAQPINALTINTGGTPQKVAYIPPVPLPTDTLNALTINATRLLINIAYTPKPRQIAPQTIGGSMVLPTLPKTTTPRLFAAFQSFNTSLIEPVAEPYQLSTGYKIRVTNDAGNILNLPLTSLSINTMINGVERVTAATPRQIIGGISLAINNNAPSLSYATVNSYDVNVYKLIKEQINVYTPYNIDTAAWFGASTGIVVDVIKIVKMSDGTEIESVKNTITKNLAVSYDVGVHSSIMTIRGDNIYRHPFWRSLEYQVDYDFNSSYGVISWKPPHVLEFSAGEDEIILVNSYNVSGGKIRCQSIGKPSALGIGAIVDGLRVVVDSTQESYTEMSSTVSFTGVFG